MCVHMYIHVHTYTHTHIHTHTHTHTHTHIHTHTRTHTHLSSRAWNTIWLLTIPWLHMILKSACRVMLPWP